MVAKQIRWLVADFFRGDGGGGGRGGEGMGGRGVRWREKVGVMVGEGWEMTREIAKCMFKGGMDGVEERKEGGGGGGWGGTPGVKTHVKFI